MIAVGSIARPVSLLSVCYKCNMSRMVQSNGTRMASTYINLVGHSYRKLFHEHKSTVNLIQYCSYMRSSWILHPCQLKLQKHLQKNSIRNFPHSASWDSSSSIPPDVIQTAFGETSKEKVIKYLQKLRPNKRLLAGCKEEAAVLVPFCTVNSQPSVLFTLRSTRLVKHRGEVSFPGGKKDDQDKNLVETAVRETVEELGIDSSQVDVWASLPPMPDRIKHFAITPVFAYLGEVDVETLPFNHHEVSEVFTLPLSHLAAHRRYTRFKPLARMPVFVGGPHNIWGLTAIMLDRTLETLFPGHYKMITKR